MTLVSSTELPKISKRLNLGVIGGGAGAFIGQVHANGARLSNRWNVVAGCLSSDKKKALLSGKNWMLESDRIYTDFRSMAEI